MAYVDLNPIRAKLAQSPEQSEYTSIKSRLSGNDEATPVTESVSRMLKSGELHHFDAPTRPLMRFSEDEFHAAGIKQAVNVLPMRQIEYLKLVDMTGRIVVTGKPGRIDPPLEPILSRLGLSIENWTQASTTFRQSYRNGLLRLKRSA